MSTPDLGRGSGPNAHPASGEVDFSPTGHGVVHPDDHHMDTVGHHHLAPEQAVDRSPVSPPVGNHGHSGEHTSHGPAGHAGHLEHGQHRGHPGHGGHAGHSDHVGMFRRLFWVMLVIGLPVVVFSDMFAMILGYTLPDVALIDWISPVLGSVMYVWGGRPFLTGAVSEIKGRQPGMMLLVALAITVAFVASWGATLGVLSHELDFWWELSLLIVIMLLGHWIEMRSLAQSSSALESLAALLPDQAEKLVGDTYVRGFPRTVRWSTEPPTWTSR
jgi:Cu2+-exporting ATPase